MNLTETYPTLLTRIMGENASYKWMKAVAMVFVGTLLIAICARIQVPFWPVPMTMQSLAILVIAMAYGFRLGTITMLAYMAEGAIGLPVFASGGGLAYFMGPTGGYLAGFVVAAMIVGYLAECGWDRNFFKTFVANAIGMTIILAMGFVGLTFFLQIMGNMPVLSEAAAKAWATGVAPFLLGALAKITIAALVLPSLWNALRR